MLNYVILRKITLKVYRFTPLYQKDLTIKSYLKKLERIEKIFYQDLRQEFKPG